MEMHFFHVLAYGIFLPVSFLITLYVGRSLFKASMVFMLDIFSGRTEIANATNRLFEVGFYLMSIGYALFILDIPHEMFNYRDMIERLSSKLGGFSIFLAIALFGHLFLFFRGKRKASEAKRWNMPQAS